MGYLPTLQLSGLEAAQAAEKKGPESEAFNIIEPSENSSGFEIKGRLGIDLNSTRQLSSRLEIDFNELTFYETVGQGSCKTVYRGRWGNTNVAIVRMHKGGMIMEARVMQKMSTHPNLVQFYRQERINHTLL